MNFDDIFAEYYALYRGQATRIPAGTDREYLLGIQLANNAIRKWDRADAQGWQELWTTLQEEDGTIVSSDTSEYDMTDMRKPPAAVQLTNPASGASTSLQVIAPHEVPNYDSMTGYAYFTGSANGGYTLHLDGDISQYDGWLIDFPYLRKPVMIEDGDTVPDMSDPNFMIQEMLAARFTNARNSFGYNAAKAESSAALANMKAENNTGTFGNSSRFKQKSFGWGKGRHGTTL